MNKLLDSPIYKYLPAIVRLRRTQARRAGAIPNRETRNFNTPTVYDMRVCQDTERDHKESYLDNLKSDPEREVKDEATDYVSKYYALHHIRSLVQKKPELIDFHLISIFAIKSRKRSGILPGENRWMCAICLTEPH